MGITKAAVNKRVSKIREGMTDQSLEALIIYKNINQLLLIRNF